MSTDQSGGPIVGDAFGEVLRACHATGGAPNTVFEVIERDDGHISVGDAARYFAAPTEWPVLDRWACAQARGRVLDVGCGAGRHAIVLTHAGREVVGLDSSTGAVKVAHARGVNAVLGDAARPPDGLGTFDTIMLFGNNLGLLSSADRAPVLLDSLAALVNPGAQIIGIGLNPYLTDDRAHREYHEINKRRGHLPGQATLRVRHGKLATGWFDYLFVSPDELADLIANSPWKMDTVEEDTPNYAARLLLR